jgi:hypothetical protein
MKIVFLNLRKFLGTLAWLKGAEGCDIRKSKRIGNESLSKICLGCFKLAWALGAVVSSIRGSTMIPVDGGLG